MELGESAEETARREIYEETGIILGDMELFNVYSGNGRQQILDNGHKFYDVIILFKCKDFKGDITLNHESLEIEFFSLDSLPDRLFPSQKDIFEDLLSQIHKI